MIACSHALFASEDVPRLLRFVEEAFGLLPRFRNDEFGEFVLPSGFRFAFFRPAGAAAQHFSSASDRRGMALGVTVADVDAAYARIAPRLAALGASASGPPKEHPWGEKSFLLVDPDGNRWEVAQSPSPSGMLVDL